MCVMGVGREGFAMGSVEGRCAIYYLRDGVYMSVYMYLFVCVSLCVCALVHI